MVRYYTPFLTLVFILFAINIASASESPQILITSVQIEGQTAKDEFVAITNIGNTNIQLEGWRLSRATATGKISNLLTSFPQYELKASETIIIAHSEYAGGEAAHFFYSTSQSIAQDNSLLLYSDQGDALVDLVGMGEAALFEGSPAQNPEAGAKLERKKVNGVFQDTNNNADDFISSAKTIDETAESDDEPREEISGLIRLSEIFPVPTEGETEEWIELEVLEKTTEATGWTLSDGVKIIHTFDTPLDPGFHVFAFTRILNNEGDYLVLKNTNGNIIEQMSWGNWEDGNIEDNVPAPQAGESLIRSDETFTRTITPTRGVANMLTKPIEDNPEERADETARRRPAANRPFLPGDVVINEILPAPKDDGAEWVELYNRSAFEINLNGWTIEEGTEHQTLLEGTLGIKEKERFAIFENLKGSLNNTGDTLLLRDSSTQIIDSVTYGNWGSEETKNAPKAPSGASIARRGDGLNSGRLYEDFIISHTPTPGGPNEITDSAAAEASALVISELYPNPEGPDDQEFIEILNKSDSPVSLVGWGISDSTGMKVLLSNILEEPKLESQTFLVLPRQKTNIALNNTGGESVQLYPPNTLTPSSSVTYNDKAPLGWSYAEIDGVFQWTQKPTPGKSNVLEVPNRPPIAHIEADEIVQINTLVQFDASDSQDPDGDPLEFTWKLDGRTAHGKNLSALFGMPGKFDIALAVSDSEGATDEAKHIITVTDAVAKKENKSIIAKKESNPSRLFPIISEVLPNPSGADMKEFIELYNPHDLDIDLSGLLIDDEDGGSRPWKIPDNTIIGSNEYLVFFRDETRLALNNTKDAARLIDNETCVSKLEFGKALDDISFIFKDGAVYPSATPTPGEENIVTENSNQEKNAEDSAVSAIQTSADELRSLKTGTKVTVEGVVIAPSERFGKYFYLNGIKVQYGDLTITILAIGDRVRVTGTLGRQNNEWSIKLNDADDLILLGHEEPPTPENAGLEDIDAELEGRLVRVEGQLARRIGKNLYLADGEGEIRVYLAAKFSVDIPSVKESPNLAITGVVSQTNSGFRILPRSDADIKIQKVLSAVEISDNKTQNPPPPLTLKMETHSRQIAKILLIVAAALAFLFGVIHYGRVEKNTQSATIINTKTERQ